MGNLCPGGSVGLEYAGWYTMGRPRSPGRMRVHSEEEEAAAEAEAGSSRSDDDEAPVVEEKGTVACLACGGEDDAEGRAAGRAIRAAGRKRRDVASAAAASAREQIEDDIDARATTRATKWRATRDSADRAVVIEEIRAARRIELMII
jgi:hypothetical protein